MVNDATDLPPTGRLVAGAHRYPVRVHWEDTDQSGAVYHADYLRFLERARSEMLRCAGIDQRAAIAEGTGSYTVADLRVRYRRPARFDDALTVVSRVTAARGASCAIQQTVMREGETLAEADVTAAFVAPDGRPRRQPAAWIAAIRRLQGEPIQQ
ncbi:YbgC/FadM family acyl-CoA thioesterase [Sphingomonas sp.]|uniref:YbgC/FadM family acyl-CoA thioesterase n=1 Tax=Sphingomonas sp. TaxID=28214 RepID=UPI003B006A3A